MQLALVRRARRGVLRSASVALVSWLAASPAVAIVERTDRQDDQYLALGQRFPAVCEVRPGGSGTLIAPRFVLTAAHVASGRGGATAVACGDRVYPVKRAWIHSQGTSEGNRPPEVDLALLELESAVEGIEPVPINRGRDEAGRTAFLVGVGDYGKAGEPLTPTDHRTRAATNTVADAGPMRLFFPFEPPPLGTDLEGVSGPGDSGGPALLERDGRVVVAGVSSAADGPPGRYGLTDIYTRVSTHADWIDRTIRESSSNRD